MMVMMDKTISTVDNCTVFVSSSDAYSDIWPAFFAIFKREWPSFAGVIYLNTEEKAFECEGLNIICTQVGKQRGFGKTLRAGLDKIREVDTILLFMIDFFFEGKVNVARLDLMYRKFVEEKADVLYLTPQNPCSPEAIEGLPSCVRAQTPFNSGYFAFQTAFWNKRTLHRLVRDWENPWHAEFYSFLRMRFMRPCPKVWMCRADAMPIPYDMAGVLHGGGRWLKPALAKIDFSGIAIDFSRRAFYESNPHENSRIVWNNIRPCLSNFRSAFSVFWVAVKWLLHMS